MENIKSNLVRVLIPSYRMHSQLFANVIEGISLEDAKQRINGRTNHVLWMVGNLVNCRYWLANALGLSEKDPNDALFADAKALDESFDYPQLENLKTEWHKISPLVFNKLCNLTDEELLRPYSIGMETSFIEENYLNAIGMCIDREEYLLGQLGLMRKILGYDAMKYQIDPNIPY